ncbi:hypothetical protein [Flavobacterium sp. ov086]|uniref:hypothetical protein n=1 Tax=Flavobacterium sp. ov086 TaxID=1761785 RepID=UPI000B678AA4|nr:hypothetical protein [Flavobacterium sp. ov086]SNR97710.1 hypothetical protein SAMN04487979_13710 [Flavobacterium sp. ov086]
MNLLEVDYRANSLDVVINGLKRSIDELKHFSEKNQWYDGLFLLEDSEHIFGLAFIAFQNYINASIKDLTAMGGKELQRKYYKHDVILSHNYTRIELIICLANYIKHKEDDTQEFHMHTKKVLEVFSFNTDKDCDITESAVFKGLDLLDKNWDLIVIKNFVFQWRKSACTEILSRS